MDDQVVLSRLDIVDSAVGYRRLVVFDSTSFTNQMKGKRFAGVLCFNCNGSIVLAILRIPDLDGVLDLTAILILRVDAERE